MANGIVFEFLDVGMGDATLIQFPPWDQGEMCLVDFGEYHSPFKTAAVDALKALIERISLITLKRNPKRKGPYLDYLILTHAHADHWNKIGWLIDGVAEKTEEGKDYKYSDLWKDWGGWPSNTTLEIGSIYYGGTWSAYEHSNKTLAAKIAKIVNTNAGALQNDDHSQYDMSSGTIKPWLTSGGANVYLLSANNPTAAAGPNETSIVIMVEYDSRKVILTGDAPGAIEASIVERYKGEKGFLECDALKMGHHGSKASSTDSWLKVVQPKVVFASGDRYWGHPYCEAISRVKTLATDIRSHWYACSESGAQDDYVSSNVKTGVCTSIWYVVTQANGVTLNGSNDGKTYSFFGKNGLYTGTQWRLSYDPGVARYLMYAPNVWPAP
jgi:competence protein ComEC